LIDENPTLTPIQKFFYLRGALSGEALNCIKCLETTSDNYKIAWKSLVDRFNNNKILVQTHIKLIVEAEAINNESARKLRQFVDNLIGHIRALEALGQTPNAWGPLLTHIILSKVDKGTLRAWETIIGNAEVSTPPQVIEFLEARAKMFESIEASKSINTKGLTDS